MTGNGPGHGRSGGLGSIGTDISSGACFQFWLPEPRKRTLLEKPQGPSEPHRHVLEKGGHSCLFSSARD